MTADRTILDALAAAEARRQAREELIARAASAVAIGTDEARTIRVLRGLPDDVRTVVARVFIGFVCVVEWERVSGVRDTAVEEEVAVEGVAEQTTGTPNHALIVTRRGDFHDLSRMVAINLSTVRSIRTLRRF